jgi:16S rRNA (cytidine1402-2'-O)-methyltransferase
MTGTLFLVPNTLGDSAVDQVLPEQVLVRFRSLAYLIAENPKMARQLIKRTGSGLPIQEIRIEKLDKHTPESELGNLLAPIENGCDGGLVSDAGCPAVADPGSPLVLLAHTRGVRVAPLTGPSSIMLALMASGLDGQRFTFHGYLPVNDGSLAAKLRSMEKESRQLRQTQIFIETPYRNLRMLAALLQTLGTKTLLCTASDLTLDTESIITRSVGAWRHQPPPPLRDRPTVFLLSA